MKKTLVAILALGGMAMAESTVPLGTHTWISTEGGTTTAYTEASTNAVMGGTTNRTDGGRSVPAATYDTTSGYVNSYTYDERDTMLMHDAIVDALATDVDRELTFNITLTMNSPLGGASNTVTLLQVGQKGKGFGIAVQGNGTSNPSLYITTNNSNSHLLGDLVWSYMDNDTVVNDISITLAAGTISYTNVVTDTNVGGTKSQTITNTIAFTNDDIAWHASEMNDYSIGQLAPGYKTDNNIANMGISAFSATISTPEPATATLSLLALAGLASRRRRH